MTTFGVNLHLLGRSHQQSQCCCPSHTTWYLSTPSPHTKNQPTNVRLLLHTGKHVHASRLHMAVFHSHLVDFSACCCFCVYVLCSQLTWKEKSPQDKVVYTSNSLYNCMTSSTSRSWYCRKLLCNQPGTYECRKALPPGTCYCKLLDQSTAFLIDLWSWIFTTFIISCGIKIAILLCCK